MARRINFSGVKDLEIVEPGMYDGHLADQKWGLDAKGGDLLTLTFEADVNGTSRKLFRNFSLSEAALWAVKQVCTRLGADPAAFTDDCDLEEIIGGLIGTQCTLDVGTHEFNGTTYNDIKSVRSGGMTGAAPAASGGKGKGASGASPF